MIQISPTANIASACQLVINDEKTWGVPVWQLFSAGRAFGTAELIGINNHHLFGLAMALSLAIVSIAGVFLCIRTNFDPSIGPTRLIFAFEAIIIGGLGGLGLVLAVLVVMYLILRSRWGLALTAIRDSEPAAESSALITIARNS